MPSPVFRLDPSAVVVGNCAAYELSPTPDYPITGRVVATIEQHQVSVDDRVEPRPLVRFEFSDLTVDGDLLGKPFCTAEFHPDVAEATGGYRMVSLSEPGYLRLVTASWIALASDRVHRCVTDLLAALTVDFLTDARVARARRDEAFTQLQQARIRYLGLASSTRAALDQVARTRATLAAAIALLRSVQDPPADPDRD